jgi:ElaB/YqjD/DUF883 family membrane-anchored ribosome-binding protein
MAKIDFNTKNGLYQVQERLNSLLDHVIMYRQGTVYKADYRYISNHIQKALTNINEAIDRTKERVYGDSEENKS